MGNSERAERDKTWPDDYPERGLSREWVERIIRDREIEIESLRQQLEGAVEERDALRAECDRLRAQQAESLESVRQAWDEVARLRTGSGGQ